MRIVGNGHQSGQLDMAWFVQRYADSSKLLRSHYESLLNPSRNWRSWAAGRINQLRSIGVVLPRVAGDDGAAVVAMLLPAIYRWVGSANPLRGSPFYWPRLPLLGYPPLWRLLSPMQPHPETGLAEEAGSGYFGAGEHLAAPSSPVGLVAPRTSLLSLAALPSRLPPAGILTSNSIISIAVLRSPETALLYPETELVYRSTPAALRMASHRDLHVSLDGQGALSSASSEPTSALTQDVPLPDGLVPSSAAPIPSGPLTLKRLPMLSTIIPATFTGSESPRRDSAGIRRLGPPLLILPALRLTMGTHLEPRGTSGAALSMPLELFVYSNLTQARDLALHSLPSPEAVLRGEQGNIGEGTTALSSPALRKTTPSSGKMSSSTVEAFLERIPPSRGLPSAPEPRMLHRTLGTGLLRESVNRLEEMLVCAREGYLAEEEAQLVPTLYPSVMRSSALLAPDEPYLAAEAIELFPTTAARTGNDEPASHVTHARSAAFVASRSLERLPLIRKTLYPVQQRTDSRERADDLYSALSPIDRMAGPAGESGDAQPPPDEQDSRSPDGLQQIAFSNRTSVGEPARILPNRESVLSWPEGPEQGGRSSPLPSVSNPMSAGAGHGGWSLPAMTGSSSLSTSTTSQPAVARALVDRPTDGAGGQEEEPEQGVALDEIAQEVYSLLKRRLALERERSWGIG